MRTKNEVLEAFDVLIQDMDVYLSIWKKTRGTTDHYIGIMINFLKSYKEKWNRIA